MHYCRCLALKKTFDLDWGTFCKVIYFLTPGMKKNDTIKLLQHVEFSRGTKITQTKCYTASATATYSNVLQQSLLHSITCLDGWTCSIQRQRVFIVLW